MLPGLVCFSFLKIRFGSEFEPTDVIIAIVPRSLIGMAHVCTRFQFIVPIGWQLVHPGPLLPLLFPPRIWPASKLAECPPGHSIRFLIKSGLPCPSA